MTRFESAATRRLAMGMGAALLLAAGACSSQNNPVTEGKGGSGGFNPGGSGGSVIDECDLDGDGVDAPSCGGDDCNDRNPTVYPGAAEVCSGGLDENCNGTIDEGCECKPGDVRPCYPLGDDDPTRDVGACADGQQTCNGDGQGWGECTGAVTPREENVATCDGVDQDCDGTADEGLVNRCGVCGEEPVEVCGNGLDDDCDDEIDPPAFCDVSCVGVDVENPQPPGLACCFKDPDEAGLSGRPVPFSTLCVEYEGLPACSSDERRCLDLDGDPTTLCGKRCFDDNRDGAIDRCVCGAASGDDDPAPTDACGFETPCARMDCDGRTNQPCYSGNPSTLGKGICHGGTTSCVDAGAGLNGWGTCEGEQLPDVEICGDSVDNDCDGLVDEEDGATHKRCVISRCPANAVELCNDGEDNDCDGFVDEGCMADADEQDCFIGPPGTRGLGACTDGKQKRDGDYWGACEGSIGPAAELCGDGVDSDCDGFGAAGSDEDTGCCAPTGDETCNGEDDDCDGLVDEGVVSACGTCSDEPCYVEEFHEPASCLEGNGRICDRIIPDENNPDAFSLSTDKRGGGGTNVIYIAVTGRDQVAKLDTITGQKIWQADTYGDYPSRTAVPLDNSVWVANRGFQNANDPQYSNVVHLDRDGNLICKAETPGLARGLAIDAYGDVWAGMHSAQTLYRISGTGVGVPGADGIPRCDMYDLNPNDPNSLAVNVGESIYGLAISESGILWSSSSPAVRYDTQAGTWEKVAHTGGYGIVVDGNGDAWFGSGITRVNGVGPYANQAAYNTQTNPPVSAGAVTADEQGYIWGVTIFGTTLSKVDPVTMAVTQYTIPGGSHGVAPDDAGKIWAPGGSSVAHRFDPINLTWDTFTVDNGQSNYTYSDMTGALLRQFVARQGSWTQIYDSGYATTDWKRLDWQQLRPQGTQVQVFARFANTRDALDTTALVCGPYEEPPIDLDSCPGIDNARYAAVNFLLRSGRDGSKPVVGHVQLSWTRP